MRQLLKIMTLVIATVAAPATTWAETAIAGKVGTTGVGLEVSHGLSPHWVLRGGVASFEGSQTFDTDTLDYDGDLELLQASLLFDWHPGGGAFRLSAGAVWNDNRLAGEASLAAVAADVFGIDPEILGLFDLGVVRAEVTTDPIGPYLGLGWGDVLGGAGSRLRFSFDLGVVYHGSPTAAVVVDSPALDLVPEVRPLLDAFLEQEVRELEADVEKYRYFPVLSLGLSYRF